MTSELPEIYPLPLTYDIQFDWESPETAVWGVLKVADEVIWKTPRFLIYSMDADDETREVRAMIHRHVRERLAKLFK